MIDKLDIDGIICNSIEKNPENPLELNSNTEF